MPKQKRDGEDPGKTVKELWQKPESPKAQRKADLEDQRGKKLTMTERLVVSTKKKKTFNRPKRRRKGKWGEGQKGVTPWVRELQNSAQGGVQEGRGGRVNCIKKERE